MGYISQYPALNKGGGWKPRPRPSRYAHLITRQIDFEGERWRVTSVSAASETVWLNIVNVPGETVRKDILHLPLKQFLSLLPRR